MSSLASNILLYSVKRDCRGAHLAAALSLRRHHCGEQIPAHTSGLRPTSCLEQTAINGTGLSTCKSMSGHGLCNRSTDERRTVGPQAHALPVKHEVQCNAEAYIYTARTGLPVRSCCWTAVETGHLQDARCG